MPIDVKCDNIEPCDAKYDTKHDVKWCQVW